MKIAYVLAAPELCGGVKVVFQHARLLQLAGHDVSILGLGPKPDWLEVEVNYLDYSQGKPELERQDLVIATYFSTIPIAESMHLGPLVHFCQGYEGDFAHLAPELPQIEAVYSRPLPTIVVAPHLVQLLDERHGRKCRIVSPPLDLSFSPALRLWPRARPWIFIPGIFEADFKGVRTALAAVRKMRADGLPCRVLRCSTLPLSAEERELLEPDRYLTQLKPREVAENLRQCDLMLFPSTAIEGFGLPVLEAMVSKVPVIASAIPSVQFISAGELTLVSPSDSAAFAREAVRLLRNPLLWQEARNRGFHAAQNFQAQKIARQLSDAIEWAHEMSSVTV